MKQLFILIIGLISLVKSTFANSNWTDTFETMWEMQWHQSGYPLNANKWDVSKERKITYSINSTASKSGAGYARLRKEWQQLMDVERPKVVETIHWAAKNGDRSENGDYIYGKRRLREIDRRIQFLTKRLEIAEVVDASIHEGLERIFFGATVTYAEEQGTDRAAHNRTVHIVGVDEADSLAGQVSWISPIAKALLKNSVGDVVRLMTPSGWQEVEILAVEYPSPSTSSSSGTAVFG